MSALLEALRLGQPLPSEFRWPQVRVQSGNRPRWPAGLPGIGDEATWFPYEGHPNDPRAPERSDADALLDAVGLAITHLRLAEKRLEAGDSEAAHAAIDDAVRELKGDAA